MTGVWVTCRNRLKPASSASCRTAAGPAWAPSASAFRVARGSGGSPAAFQCLCEATSVPAWLLAADPVAATWREHLRANPVPRGQQVLFLRHMLAADDGEATTPAHAALILDLKRRYLEMRPRLRRIYSLAADPAAALSQFAPLGFARLPDGAAADRSLP